MASESESILEEVSTTSGYVVSQPVVYYVCSASHSIVGSSGEIRMLTWRVEPILNFSVVCFFVRRTLLIFGVVGVLGVAVVKAIYEAFSKPGSEESEPESAQLMTRPVKMSELQAATGEGEKNLFIGVKDPHSSQITVFDVSAGKDFYGPGGPYHVFAGRNASHGLATSSMDPDTVEGDISNLTASEKDTHMGWYNKYASKYTIIGFLVPNDYVAPEQDPVSTGADSKKDA